MEKGCLGKAPCSWVLSLMCKDTPTLFLSLAMCVRNWYPISTNPCKTWFLKLLDTGLCYDLVVAVYHCMEWVEGEWSGKNAAWVHSHILYFNALLLLFIRLNEWSYSHTLTHCVPLHFSFTAYFDAAIGNMHDGNWRCSPDRQKQWLCVPIANIHTVQECCKFYPITKLQALLHQLQPLLWLYIGSDLWVCRYVGLLDRGWNTL